MGYYIEVIPSLRYYSNKLKGEVDASIPNQFSR